MAVTGLGELERPQGLYVVIVPLNGLVVQPKLDDVCIRRGDGDSKNANARIGLPRRFAPGAVELVGRIDVGDDEPVDVASPSVARFGS